MKHKYTVVIAVLATVAALPFVLNRPKPLQQTDTVPAHSDRFGSVPSAVNSIADETEAPELIEFEKSTITLSVPGTLPPAFKLELPFQDETLQISLTKHSVRGPNTKVLMSDDNGGFAEMPLPPVNSYLGVVDGRPDLRIVAAVGEHGLDLTLCEEFGDWWVVEPMIGKAGEHTLARHGTDASLSTLQRLRSDQRVAYNQLSQELGGIAQGFAALPVIPEKRAELAVDLDYDFAVKHCGHPGGTLTTEQEAAVAASGLQRAEYLASILNGPWESSYAVSWEVGTLLIRNDITTDPYQNTDGYDTFNVARNFWVYGNPPGGKTFDTVVTGHGNSLGGGVSGLAASNVAAVTGGSVSGWASVSIHEVHHNWGHPHGIGRGSDLTPWGQMLSHSMIIGSYTAKENYGGYVRTIGNKNGRGLDNTEILTPRKPYGAFDTAASVVVGAGNSVLIDVLGNDHDPNNDQVRLLNKFSSNQHIFIATGSGTTGISAGSVTYSSTTYRGGTVELIPGTGGQRDQVRYTPPVSTTATFDAFHYYMVDNSGTGGTDGLEAWGMVKVGLLKPTTINLSASSYGYDAGPASSHKAGSRAALCPETFGDVYWSSKPSAADRWVANGDANTVFRDLILSSATKTLNHKIANGTWEVAMQMGDRDSVRNDMTVKAEGATALSNIDSSKNAFVERKFVVDVTDGELNLEFSAPGYWVLNGLTIKTYDPSVHVDTTKTAYNYDLGTPSSPVFSDWSAIHPAMIGDIEWTGTVDARDRGTATGANDSNRDHIFGTAPATLEHKIANGYWRVTMNMGDATTAHDNMRVFAEGELVTPDLDSAAGAYPYAVFTVPVRDGSLSIEFSDAGGTDPEWVVGRMSLKKVGEITDLSLDQYNYDPGPTDSTTLNSEWTVITPDMKSDNSDVYWASTVSATDRGPDTGNNNINRDFIHGTAPATLHCKVANGPWHATMNIGDADMDRDNIRVTMIDGGDTDVVSPAAGTTPYVHLYGTVTDGYLTLTFSDDGGGTDPEWLVNRLSLIYENGRPTADDKSATVMDGQSVGVTLTGDDPDGTPSFRVIGEPAQGSLSGTGANLTYVPYAGFTGTDTFIYVAHDEYIDSAPATVTITVEENPNVDGDGDGVSDRAEYAFGGDAGDPAVQGTLPKLNLGSGGMEYVYTLRGDTTLTATVMIRTNLTAGSWEVHDVQVGAGGTNHFGSITNSLPADEHLFIKLNVE